MMGRKESRREMRSEHEKMEEEESMEFLRERVMEGENRKNGGERKTKEGRGGFKRGGF